MLRPPAPGLFDYIIRGVCISFGGGPFDCSHFLVACRRRYRRYHRRDFAAGGAAVPQQYARRVMPLTATGRALSSMYDIARCLGFTGMIFRCDILFLSYSLPLSARFRFSCCCALLPAHISLPRRFSFQGDAMISPIGVARFWPTRFSPFSA